MTRFETILAAIINPNPNPDVNTKESPFQPPKIGFTYSLTAKKVFNIVKRTKPRTNQRNSFLERIYYLFLKKRNNNLTIFVKKNPGFAFRVEKKFWGHWVQTRK